MTATAFGLAAQSTLAPLLPSTLVANAFFAKKFLGESITKYDIQGMVMMMFGAGFVVAGAPAVAVSGDANTFVDYFLNDIFLVTLSGVLLLGAGLQWAKRRYSEGEVD
jgi:hypothetical protein